MSHQVSKAFSSAADSYEFNAALQVQVGHWLVESLPESECLLDVGCGTGFIARVVKERRLARVVVGLDRAWNMLKVERQSADSLVCADMSSLPFKDGSFDCVTSSLALQWAEAPGVALHDLLRVLKPRGRLMFTVPLPGSLVELEDSWREIGDSYGHVNQFCEMDEWRRIVQSALKELGVQQVETRIVTEQREFVRWFESPREALRSLKGVGANKVMSGARPGLTGKSQFSAMLQAYERRRSENGIPMTYQVMRLTVDL